MSPHYFIQALFLLAGVVALLAAILNWDWFFKAYNAQAVVRRLGRKRARLLYGFLGVVLIGMAVFFYISVSQVKGGV